MEITYWNPSREYTKLEKLLLKRLKRTKKLFAFLRTYRHELFDEAFQEELASMYRDTGAGKEPVMPAIMAMAVLLQAYAGVSDAEAVELTVVDLRWQMVLGCLGEITPAFSQGAFWDFRERLIRHDMDRRMLERTRELARKTNAFDWRKLPKEVRVAMDSAPLEGAGRVEDTINLLAHAARRIVVCAADILGCTFEKAATEAGISLLLASSVKAGLDMRWDRPGAMNEALERLTAQIDSLETWIEHRLHNAAHSPPMKVHLQTLAQIRDQDLEPDPSGGGVRIRRGVAPERRISIEDGEMRHGRKSKSHRFNGYKRHIAVDLEAGLILACALAPANQAEHEAAASLNTDIERQDAQIASLYIDRGYIASPVVEHVLDRKGAIICRPWSASNAGELFSKHDFKFDMRRKTITCPAGQTKPFGFDKYVEFDANACGACSLRSQCTKAQSGRGRSVHIANNEKLQHRLRKSLASSRGRAELRTRVAVEHKLAHICQRQGRRARYRGTRKNLFDLRRAAAIQNMETIQRTVVSLANAA